MAQNIVISIFEVESEAYQAMTTLFQDSYTAESYLKQAVLVKKEEIGIRTLDYFEAGKGSRDHTAMGGMMGAFMGVLAGPLGVLLGAGYGMLVGRNVDALYSLKDATLLEQIIGKIQVGDVAIIGLANEEDESILDEKLGKFKTITLRYDAAVVAEEVEEAVKIEKELERQARAALRKEKNEEFKSRIERRRSILKGYFEEATQNIDLDVRY